MSKKFQSITRKASPAALIVLLLIVWQAVCSLGVVPPFMLPSPAKVVQAFAREFPVLMGHTAMTLSEAFAGLAIGIAAAFLLAAAMDSSRFLYDAVYPILLITQTVPTIAVAPLLVLWMGYGVAPKITLVFLTCFFPVTIGLLDGFRSADVDAVRLMGTMGASHMQVFRHIKFPYALPGFFTGLKTSVTYSVVGAVIAEWLGGDGGLGVYMTRVRKSFAFDKMFAVIFWISILSLLLMRLTMLLEKRCMPWKRTENSDKNQEYRLRSQN